MRGTAYDPRQTDNLLLALLFAERAEEAYKIFTSAKEQFRDDWALFITGGEVCCELGRYDEAAECYKTAGEIGTNFCDDLDCLANLYMETGEYQKANETRLKMAEVYSSRGFDMEAERMKRFAKEALEKQKPE